MTKQFIDYNISENILNALGEMDFSVPTEIQDKSISVLLESNKDFVGQAQTGTGKTAAFVVPLLEKINEKKQVTQALILAPTRELAMQVEEEIKKIGKHTKIKSTCVYGGTAYEGQLQALRGQPHIVVGTPGRVLDLLGKRKIKLSSANFCVLDEADEMLTMGFLEDVQEILSFFTNERQLIMFSATMPRPIVSMIDREFKNPTKVHIEKKTMSNSDIEQKYFVVRDKHLKEGLSRLIDDAHNVYGIVFCRTKIETREVADDLKRRGHLVEVLNGDMGQTERDLAMKNFRSKKVNLLVCTDVAARGIDINNLTHVFNYGMPRDNESYVHRIGRTGRAGEKGKAYSVIGAREASFIKGLEKHIKQKIIKDKLPTVEKLKESLVLKDLENAKYILDAVLSKGDDFKTEKSFEHFKEKFGELETEELLKVMFVWKFNKDMRRYNNLADIESTSSSDKPKKRINTKVRNERISRRNKRK